jgi:two-component system, NarL family, invasion response regulator UvrY
MSNPYTLMLVDDHEVVRSGYRRFLEADPSLSVVAEAASAEQAYAALQQAESTGRLPQLVVVDISLGGRSGLDLIERCAQRFAGLRMLVFSMHEDALMLEHALAAGACGYVSKSSPPGTVLKAIELIRAGGRFIDPALSERQQQLQTRRSALEQLSRREIEIVWMLARGMDLVGVARTLALSAKTVANHLSSVRAKLKVDNDFQLMRLVAEVGLPPISSEKAPENR